MKRIICLGLGYNEKLHDSYRSPSIVKIVKSVNLRGDRHMTRTKREEIHTEFCWEYLLGNVLVKDGDNIKMELREIGCDDWEVDGTGLESHSMADFIISGVEPSHSISTALVSWQ
jgi:hypothetical protein